LPLEGDNTGVQIAVANNDPNPVTVLIYTGTTNVNNTTQWSMTLQPGETQTYLPPAGIVSFLSLSGATDNANVQALAQHTHTVNGKVVSETVPAIPTTTKSTGEWTYAPAPLVPGRIGEQDTMAQGYWIITLDANAGSQVGLLNRVGNPDPSRITTHNLDAWSAIYVPDFLAELNIQGISKGQLLFQPTSPGIIAATKLLNNTSGDHHTVHALAKRLAENKFSFPLIRHLTTGVQFPQYTDIDVINPDPDPLTQFFGTAYQPRGATGTPTDGGGAQLDALTHYLYQDAIQTFFGYNSNPADMIGAATGSNAATMLAWNTIRTAMPHGDVGAMFAAINNRDSCGTTSEYQCNLIGLRQGDGYTTKIEINNLSSATNVIKAEVITEAGVIAGTTQYTLRDRENIEITDLLDQYGTLTNARVRLTTIRSGGSGTNMDAFTAAAITTSLDGDEDYQQAVKGAKLPAANVTGDQVLAMHLDYIVTNAGSFYLSNREIGCATQGNCGVASITDTLSQIYARGTSQDGCQVRHS
jgi:hypothetical protein